MLFNSIDFAIFLPIVFIFYWFMAYKNFHSQNLLIVISSYVFYGWWDWRFLFLILISTATDYLIGLKIFNKKNETNRKLLLSISIIVNLGLLVFFKYFNFFVDNFITVFSFLGFKISSTSLNIILPIGISFYTFQTLSYTIDVYRGKLEPTKDFIAFSAFISFFPQLVAGPIEKASNLIPQFTKKRTFNYNNAVDGLKQILWGIFKKVVIADNCAYLSDTIFNNSGDYSGSTLFIGAVLFSFQIYGDFSGYSDIAIGTSKLFGIKLKQNFAFPYFSRDIAEFWRRWHISLTTWFRDYLYIPLGGSRSSIWITIRNIFIVFIVSGIWHGANWTFVIWGMLNAFYFLFLLLINKYRTHLDIAVKRKTLPALKDAIKILITFSLTSLAWVFFRAENVNQALNIISDIFSKSLLTIPEVTSKTVALLLIVFVFLEWIGRENQYAIEKIALGKATYIRWLFYMSLIYLVLFFQGQKQEFIYFQF